MTLNGWHRLYLVAVVLLAAWIGAVTYLALIDTPDELVGDLVRSAAVIWLVVSVALYGLGAGVAWTIRGFRQRQP